MYIKQMQGLFVSLDVAAPNPFGAALVLNLREVRALQAAAFVINKARGLLQDTYGEDACDGIELDTECACAEVGIEALLGAGNMDGGGVLPPVPVGD